jgi:hypothetical protein
MQSLLLRPADGCRQTDSLHRIIAAKIVKTKLLRSNQSNNRFPTISFLISFQKTISFMVLGGEFTGRGDELSPLIFMFSIGFGQQPVKI